MPLRAKSICVSIFCLLLLTTPETAYCDNIPVARTIAPAKWQELTTSKDFYYKDEQELVKPEKPRSPGMLQKLLGFLAALFSGGVLLFWLLLAAALVFVVYKLFISKDSFIFGKSKKTLKDDSPPPPDDEDITTTNWELLLQQAVARNDVRMAVRYSYMWLLQLLQQREMIQYRTDKTNYDYYTELNDTRYKQPFKQLSRQYEYAWYGQLPVSVAGYNQYIDLFNKVKKDLNA